MAYHEQMEIKETTMSASKMLKKGWDPNIRDSEGKTPLMIVDDPSSIQKLIDNGADMEATDQWGNTPLHYHARAFSEAGVDTLVANGADVSVVNDRGQTPLHWSALSQTTQTLVGAGADPDKRDNNGQTPFHTAKSGFELDALDAGSHDPLAYNRPDKQGNTPLHEATNSGVMQHLLKNGADPFARNHDGLTPKDMDNIGVIQDNSLNSIPNSDPFNPNITQNHSNPAMD